MKIRIQKFTWTCASLVLALMSSSPAMADDTELLLVNPDPSSQPTPNVMFILDTSGSMGSSETTNRPYDNTVTYSGSCATDTLYWTDVDVTPVCDSNNTQFVNKSSFFCDFAAQQISGIGSFSNTMVQYRSETTTPTSGPAVTGPAMWQYLEPGNDTASIECEADRGVHGDGTAGDVYADNGSNLSNPWTSDKNSEISWGSAPRNLNYTVYDGNYLNWKASPVSISMTRSDIMKTVTKKVLQSVNNMNVGIMRFNDQEGGPVTMALTDLDTNRASIISTIDNLNPNGWTPLSETLYESALYWLGAPADYGENINDFPTDPNALVSSNPEVYSQPSLDQCAKNYNVLLTDGTPTEDTGSQTKVPNLPNFSTVTGRSSCTTTGDGGCLIDVSEYLGKVDTSSNSGTQTVTTHTIGFTVDLPLLRDTALASGGQYFLADDVETLTLALLQILANINDRSLSFSAPAVSVNTFNRTQNLNDLYLTMFGVKAKTHWPGNLKKYKIVNRVISDANDLAAVDPTTGFFFDTALSYWTVGGADGNDARLGGAANMLPDPSVRNLFTNNAGSALSSSANLITPSNSGAFTLANFGLSGVSGEPTKDQMIRWMRGEDVRDEDGNAATTVRNAMGDPLHSQPAAIVYGGTLAAPEAVVYTATNDGYLHAIDATTGTELWSFVPKELLPNMTRLYFDAAAKYKQYGIDGNVVPIVRDSNNNGIVDGSDFVVILFGMRRGGTTYYALDVTDKNAPVLLWQNTLTGAGQSWSTPVIARIDIAGATQNVDKAVVILGGGYDPVHDTRALSASPDAAGAGVHFLDLQSGAELWRAGPDSGADRQLAGMTRALATEIRVVDVSGDGTADRMYASDMGGQLWRFDILNGQTRGNLVNGGVIAQLGAEGLTAATDADTRRFYNAPDVSIFNDVIQDRRFIAVSIGSGYRARPFDLTAADRFFSIRDPDVFKTLTQTEYDNYIIATDNDLVEVGGQSQVVITSGDRGWRFTLPANQKVLADSVTFDDSVFFVAFTPDSSAAASCTAGRGTNFLYRVSIVNGDPVVNNLDTLADSDADAARRTTLSQGGIAPTPTVLFPSPDPGCTGAACSPPPIMCIGVECNDPGFSNNPVRTLWTQDGIM